MRLDRLVVQRGLAESRERAARLIMAGQVLVANRRIDKAGTLVPAASPVTILTSPPFVSRGGEKLRHALDGLGIEVRDRVAIDVGASTGGFTDCLLQRGARQVYAVDVGRGQLHPRLRADARVVVFEGTNARRLEAIRFEPVPDLAVVDVSFISLRLVLPAVFSALTGAGQALALVKPQFEVGRALVGRGGVVRDPMHRRAALSLVAEAVLSAGWHVAGFVASPLRGPKGNREFFLHLRPGAAPTQEGVRWTADTLA